MIVLGADSSAQSASCALTVDKKVVAAFTVDAGNTHSTTLLPMIKACCDRAGVSPDEIDLFACAVGPGSFTGVRIGVSTVKGLCASRSVPCVGVSSLEGMAQSFGVFRGLVVPVMDARRSNVYTAIFLSGDEGLSRLTQDLIIPTSELCDLIAERDIPVLFIGDSSDTLCDMARERGLKVCPSSPVTRAPSAVGVCALAEAEYESTEDKTVYTAAALSPVYLRPGRAGNAPLQEDK